MPGVRALLSPAGLPVAGRLLLATLAALALGVLTADAQGWLPSGLSSLANSSGPWALVAFGLAALLAWSTPGAALIGALGLWALLLGYALGAGIRGASASASLLLFWGVAGLLAGPVLGIGAYWVRGGGSLRRASAVGVLGGILVGEAIYGLTVIAGTTSTVYWWAELLVGLTLVLATAARTHPRERRTAAVALSLCALTAGAFIAAYNLDLIAVLP